MGLMHMAFVAACLRKKWASERPLKFLVSSSSTRHARCLQQQCRSHTRLTVVSWSVVQQRHGFPAPHVPRAPAGSHLTSPSTTRRPMTHGPSATGASSRTSLSSLPVRPPPRPPLQLLPRPPPHGACASPPSRPPIPSAPCAATWRPSPLRPPLHAARLWTCMAARLYVRPHLLPPPHRLREGRAPDSASSSSDQGTTRRVRLRRCPRAPRPLSSLRPPSCASGLLRSVGMLHAWRPVSSSILDYVSLASTPRCVSSPDLLHPSPVRPLH